MQVIGYEYGKVRVALEQATQEPTFGVRIAMSAKERHFGFGQVAAATGLTTRCLSKVFVVYLSI